MASVEDDGIAFSDVRQTNRLARKTWQKYFQKQVEPGKLCDSRGGRWISRWWRWSGRSRPVASNGSLSRHPRRNMKLNGFESELYSYKTCDANTFLNELPENPLFDLAVVDPPTFSNSKKTDTIWEVQKDHVALLENVAKRMATGGLVFFSTNFRRFQLNTEGLSFFHEIREISQQTLPEDFRNQRIHRCWQMKVGP